MKPLRICLTALSLLLVSSPGHADCVLAGTAVCDMVACPGQTFPAGSIIRNTDYGVLQVCRSDGVWQALHGFDTSPPCHSMPIGTVCSNGTVYAGLSPAGLVPMFVTRCDAGQTWNGTTCTGTRLTPLWNNGSMPMYSTDTPLVNCATAAACDPDGKTNTATLVTSDSDSNVAGDQPHQAAQYCHDLNLHGFSDWYLPSIPELDVIYDNRIAIGLFNSTSYYFSSSEADFLWMWYHRFNQPTAQSTGKATPMSIRCARH